MHQRKFHKIHEIKVYLIIRFTKTHLKLDGSELVQITTYAQPHHYHLSLKIMFPYLCVFANRGSVPKLTEHS